MKKTAFAMLCASLIIGCATYVPTVSNPPKDQATLDADIATCEKEKEKRMENASNNHQGDNAIMAGFGLLGAAVVNSKHNPNDDYFKSPKQMIDECMAEKGYKITH